MERALMCNVGGGPGGSAGRTASMCRWAARALSQGRPRLVFAQEVTDPWLDVWRAAGYQVWHGTDRGWRIRSALLTEGRIQTDPVPKAWWSNDDYHGSYVAARVWTNAPGGPLVIASVHASPSLADPDRYGWRGPHPIARDGGGDPRWTSGRLWDSDYVAASLRELAQHVDLLAAGDFNEAPADRVPGAAGPLGTWGVEYFDGLSHAGLVDVTLVGGVESLVTRGGLQLDHALATAGAATRLEIQNPRRDRAWEQAGGRHLSDHAALWFDLADAT